MRVRGVLLAVPLAVVVAAPGAAQGRLEVTARLSADRVEAGGVVTVFADVQGASAAALPRVQLDAKGVDRNGFVRRLEPSLFVCPPQRQCFSGGLWPSVHLAPGRYQVRVTATDARGAQASASVAIEVTLPADSDADGLPDHWEVAYKLDPRSAAGVHGADGDADEDGVTNAREFLARTNPVARYVRYFAEGSTGERQPIATDIQVRSIDPNPLARSSPIRVLAIGDDGRMAEFFVAQHIEAATSVSVPGSDAVADRVVLVIVETVGLSAVERQTSSGGVVVNASLGVQAPSREWHFADVCTRDGLDTFLLLFNPGAEEVAAEFTYADASRQVFRWTRRLAPGVRTTVWVNRDDAAAMGSDVAVTISASAPILAERAFRHASPGKTVPHESINRGTAVPGTRWLFPDVDGRGPVVHSLAVMNPSAANAAFRATIFFEDRAPLARSFEVASGVRRELTLADLGIPPNAAASVELRVTNSVPVVAERVSTCTAGGAVWRRTASGLTEAGARFEFAAASPLGTHPAAGELVVTNLSVQPARVEVHSYLVLPGYMGGSRMHAFAVDVAPQRVLRLQVPQPDGGRLVGPGALGVVSVPVGPGPAAEIVVERTHYWPIAGVERAGAASIVGNVVR